MPVHIIKNLARYFAYLILILLSAYSLLQIIVNLFPSTEIIRNGISIPLAQYDVVGIYFIEAMKTLWQHGLQAIPSLITAPFFGYDFGFFYYAFHQVLFHHGTDLYSIPKQTHWMKSLHYVSISNNQYVYPPQFAILLSFISLFPFKTAAFIWTGCGMIATFCSGYWLGLLATFQKPSKLIRLLILTITLSYYGLYWDFGISNSNWLILFLISWSFYLLIVKEKPRFAGVVIAIAAMFKVTPLIIIGYFLLRRQKSFVQSALLTIVIVSLLGILLIGWQPFFYYLTHFHAMTDRSLRNGAAPYNLSIVGILLWLPSLHQHPMRQPIVLAAYGLVVLLSLSLSWLSAKKANHPMQDIIIVSLLMVMVSPLIEVTHTIIVLPMISGMIYFVHHHPISVKDKKNRIHLVFLLLLSLIIIYQSFSIIMLYSFYIAPFSFTWPYFNGLWDICLLYSVILLGLGWPWLWPRNKIRGE